MPIESGSELTAHATPDCLSDYRHDLMFYTRLILLLDNRNAYVVPKSIPMARKTSSASSSLSVKLILEVSFAEAIFRSARGERALRIVRSKKI